jgi:DNA-binding transcriptional ArsR family regulator
MDLFSALADPTRRKIIEMLASQGPLSATAISDRFDVSPPAISQHLKVLREAELVQMEKRRQQRIYRINPAAMLELEEWANQIAQLWNQRFDALDEVLKAEQNKPSRKRDKREAHNVKSKHQ